MTHCKTYITFEKFVYWIRSYIGTAKWRLLISINLTSSTKEMDPITINNMSGIVAQPSFRTSEWIPCHTFVSYFWVFQMSAIPRLFGQQLWNTSTLLILTCLFTWRGSFYSRIYGDLCEVLCGQVSGRNSPMGLTYLSSCSRYCCDWKEQVNFVKALRGLLLNN